MTRDKAIDTINNLPNEFELEALFEKLVFVEKVEQGINQIEQGKTIPNAKVKEIVKEW